MPKCPLCNTPGAYIGFSSIECRNPKCTHYVQAMEALCPCCGVAGHVPSEDAQDNAVQVDYIDPSLPASAPQPVYGAPGYNNGEPQNYHADPGHYGADPSSGYGGSPDPSAPASYDPAFAPTCPPPAPQDPY